MAPDWRTRADAEGDQDGAGTGGDQKFTLLQAVGLNTMNMFGTGPFITIPYCLASVDPMGPQAMIGYGLACLACMCDSMVWSECSTMWPNSGGTYTNLRMLYGEHTWGSLVSFLYVWQFFISCPAEIASGLIAMAEYLIYLAPGSFGYAERVGISVSGAVILGALLYRKISDTGRVAIALWTVTSLCIIFVLAAGFSDFHGEYLELPKKAFSGNLLRTLTVATRFGVYDMTGYYDVCFMAGVVQDPQRTVPISCTGTCCIVSLIYIFVYLAVLGHLDWVSFVEVYHDDYAGDRSPFGIVSIFTESRCGRGLACFMTVAVSITIFGSIFSMLCGQVYVPKAAAEDGVFFKVFAYESKTYPGVAPVSLGVIIMLSICWCFFSLDLVINVLVTMLVLVQFIGQSIGLMYYRYSAPKPEQPDGWRMPFFPLPCIIQSILFFVIWISTDSVLLWSSADPILELSIAFILVGVALFCAHAKWNNKWPFNSRPSPPPVI